MRKLIYTRRERTVSINGAGKTEKPHAKGCTEPLSTPYTKSTQNGFTS